VRVGAAPVAGEVVLLEGQQVVQHLHSPFERAVELVDQLGDPQVEAVVSRSGAARFDGPVEEVASQVAAQVIRKGLDHLTVSFGVIFTLLLLLAAKNKQAQNISVSLVISFNYHSIKNFRELANSVNSR